MVTIIGESILRCGVTYDPIGSFLGYHENGGSAASYSFFNVDLGAAAEDRMIVLEVATTRSQSVARTITGVTINGIAATIIEHLANGDEDPSINPTITTAIVSAMVPTGTSATVVVTMNNAAAGAFIGVHRFTGLASNDPYDIASSGVNNSNPAVTLDVPPNGFVIAFYAGIGSHGSATWTGLSTEDVDEFAAPADSWWASLARQSGMAEQTGRAISVSAAATGRENLMAASFA